MPRSPGRGHPPRHRATGPDGAPAPKGHRNSLTTIREGSEIKGLRNSGSRVLEAYIARGTLSRPQVDNLLTNALPTSQANASVDLSSISKGASLQLHNAEAMARVFGNQLYMLPPTQPRQGKLRGPRPKHSPLSRPPLPASVLPAPKSRGKRGTSPLSSPSCLSVGASGGGYAMRTRLCLMADTSRPCPFGGTASQLCVLSYPLQSSDWDITSGMCLRCKDI